MIKKLPIIILVFILYSVAITFAQPTVRFDLILVESADDGMAITYHEPWELEVAEVSASSSLSDRYSVLNLIDGDPTTAWIEGVKGFGIGESIKLYPADSAVPLVFEIWPGYQRSESIFLRNGRPQRIRLAYVGNDPGLGDDPYFDIISYEIDLFRGYDGKIAMQPQYIYFSGGEFVHNMAMDSYEYIEIEILSVDNIETIDPDLGISEIRIFGAGKQIGVRAFGPFSGDIE